MRRRLLALTAALALAGAGFGVYQATRPETRVETLKAPSICATRITARDGARFCSHGPDRLRVDKENGARFNCTFPVFGCILPNPLAKPPAAPPPCFGTTDGKRIQIVYAYTDTNDLSAQRSKLLGVAGDADRYLSGQQGNQHYRFVCGTDGVPTVVAVKVASPTLGAFIDGARAAGMTRTDRIYASMHKSGGGGTATLDRDDSAGLSNANNSGPAYSISGANFATYVHELGHNLGAVQNSAPHSSRAGHCFDEDDIMCYMDNGPYFTEGGELTRPCPVGGVGAWDCQRNDYYHPNPLPLTYLATHWNLTRSSFLTPAT